MKSYTVTYGGEQRQFQAEAGSRLLDAILQHEPDHYHVCGGHGFCTSCRVTVLTPGGLTPPNRLERERLGSRCGRLRLACQAHVIGDVAIEPAVRNTLIDW